MIPLSTWLKQSTADRKREDVLILLKEDLGNFPPSQIEEGAWESSEWNTLVATKNE